MSAIDYAVLINRIECIEILLNKYIYSIEEYINILYMGVYSKNKKTFEFVLYWLIKKQIFLNFSFEDIYKIAEKLIIIHQYENYLLLISSMNELNGKGLKIELLDVEEDINLLILSFFSLKVYKTKLEKN